MDFVALIVAFACFLFLGGLVWLCGALMEKRS